MGRTHADELKKKAVLYINSDSNARGLLSARRQPDFEHLIDGVAADVTDPETGVSVGQRYRAGLRADALDSGTRDKEHAKAVAKIAADPSRDMPIEAIGSGSDYSAFIRSSRNRRCSASDYGGEGRHAASITPATIPSNITAASSIRASSMMRSSRRRSAALCCAQPTRTFPLQSAGDFADTVALYLRK